MASKLPDNPIAAQIDRLQRPLRNRRRLSWAAFLAVLAACLVVPLLASVMPSWISAIRPAAVSAPSAWLKLDTAWEIGAISSEHQPWAKDCKSCHSTPFKRVQDADCLACHKSIGDHVDRKTAALGELRDTRCASCHREHHGEFGLDVQNKRYAATQCSSCHANIAAHFPDTLTQNAADFGRDHPAFRVQLAMPGGKRLVRMRQQPKTPLAEYAGLKFPHDAHLDRAGIRGPQGKVRMECADCHRPTADGIGFKRIAMKDNCQSCHALKFEAAAFNREVPHGSVDDVLATLREFYSYAGTAKLPLATQSPAGSVTMMRPGKEHQPGSFVRSPGDVRSRAAAAATDLFEKTSCVICHEVSRVPGAGKPGTPGKDLPQWRIAPVTPAHAWMPKAVFSHAKHRTTACVDCHAAPKSKKASDVLMPDIAHCRDCHAGNRPEKNKVASDCGLCHGFHLPAHGAVANAGKQVSGKEQP
jgi:NAD-dependent SIR2 family protein deacetylase